MFSLCIPTLDRYDTFLVNNLPKYIENDLIEEIIIQDENGNDINKIKNSNLSLEKIKMFKNDEILGPFLNKIEVCKKAKNEWIALMDSDNFADKDYFLTVKNYIDKQKCNKTSILAPSFGRPNLKYHMWEGKILKKKDLIKFNKMINFHSCMNTGNYIINKYLIENINLEKEQGIIEKNKFSPYDVIYINTLFYEQFDLEFHVIKNLNYIHVVHDNSIYHQNNKKFRKFNHDIHQRFKRL